MKNTVLFLLFSFYSIIQPVFGQDTIVNPERYTAHNKGKIYVFWGGNRGYFSESDIHFWGKDYDFTLYNVEAHDKPKGWHVDYVSPGRMTIPQTNFRLGYFINDHYNISVGVDHMKYVMTQEQIVTIGGAVGPEYPDYSGIYIGSGNNTIDLTDETFLTFEHTDGLNYVNTEFCRVDDISNIFKIKNTDKFQLNITEGFGVGLLYPKTNTMLLGKERHDDFHVSGFGVSAKAGLNFTFFKYFFIQTELKGGYIDMNDIRTTKSSSDRASQHFTYLETVIAFGGIFRI